MLVLLAAVLGALIPTTFYVLFVWWLDRYEKEPPWLMAFAFLWGAGPAAVLSVIFELGIDVPVSSLVGGGATANLLRVIVYAPLVEESLKGIALIVLVLLFHREFDDVLDGIVYGAMIGFGFAFTENTFAYSIPALSEQGLDTGLGFVLLRTVVFGANHGFWTGITGAAVGYARLSRDWIRRILVPVGGWSLAVLFHSLHNASVTWAQQVVCPGLAGSLVVSWGGVLLLLLVAVSSLRRESRWIERGLAEEVRQGSLSPQEFDILRSAGQRLQVQWQARSRGGRTASRAVGRYFQCATELAFKKHHLRSLGDERGNVAEIERLQTALAAHRALARPWLRRTKL